MLIIFSLMLLKIIYFPKDAEKIRNKNPHLKTFLIDCYY